MKNTVKFIRLLNKIVKKKNIHKIGLHEPSIGHDDISSVTQCLKNKHISGEGPYLSRFEKHLSKIVNSKHIVCVSSGTAALHVACKLIGVEKNQEVFMPNLNYISSANAVLYCGGIPHLVDISEKTLGIDPLKLEEYIKKVTYIKNSKLYNKFTGNIIKAIIPLHTFGHPCEIESIVRIAKKYKLECIEDSAEGLGSKYNNKHLGTFGKIGILSFNGNKTISTGAGGALILNSKILEKKARILINLCKKNHKWKYDYFSLGFNYRMPNINAALGCSQIKKLKSIILHQRNLYNYYKSKLDNLGLGKVFKEPKNCKSNYWLQTFILTKSDKLLKDKILNKTNLIGVPTRTAWKLLDEINFLKKYPKMNLSLSKNIFNKIINLPSSINF
jgi:perosamine synthetase